ncbi:AGAP012063-PA-like protein [Anopheles sinensis]|uniref:non-specific serine/threonine protein kinase n=1 Tax=Anopheles sinensis TaxID=74873 RepID=A0A084WJ07_ANOSI|nr:AGAP012063-PA-like protein [Anopheles sinensis]
MKTTSPRLPDEIMAEIRSVLDKNNCDYEQRERFVLLCVHGDPNTDSLVQWEIEVCKLPRLSLNGVRFKRISEYHSVGSDTPQDDSGQGDDDGSDSGAGGGCGGTDSVGGVTETQSDPEQKHGSETRNEPKEGGSRGDGAKERESNGKNALGVAMGEVDAGDPVVTARVRSKHSTNTPNKRWSLVVVDGRSSMRCKDKNKSNQQHHYHHHPHRHHLHQQEHRQQGTPKVDSFTKDSPAHLEGNERCPTPEKIAGYNHIFASLLRTTTL